jgi:hypothetical protein
MLLPLFLLWLPLPLAPPLNVYHVLKKNEEIKVNYNNLDLKLAV